MNAIVKLFVSILTLGIVICSAFIGYAYINSNELDSMSKVFAKEEIESLSKTDFLVNGSIWKGDICNGREINPEDISSKLGKSIKVNNISGEAIVTVSYKPDEIITAAYVADIEYEKGNLKAYIKLGRKNGKWWVSNIRLQADALCM